ncbi:hypothetical protein CVT24_013082 [Panaeolus cyanescens]|uniref:Uncharacterized protein n=1 Tax=Panaeolus cyanescens TaxID=181874 RepID=A0A409VVI9_9AGAR|nr:hypothetical protein CVT24_013082 [Panaeolus cyanescens]
MWLYQNVAIQELVNHFITIVFVFHSSGVSHDWIKLRDAQQMPFILNEEKCGSLYIPKTVGVPLLGEDVQSKTSDNPGSRTTVTEKVQRLDDHDLHISQLVISPVLFQNLINYINPTQPYNNPNNPGAPRLEYTNEMLKRPAQYGPLDEAQFATEAARADAFQVQRLMGYVYAGIWAIRGLMNIFTTAVVYVSTQAGVSDSLKAQFTFGGVVDCVISQRYLREGKPVVTGRPQEQERIIPKSYVWRDNNIHKDGANGPNLHGAGKADAVLVVPGGPDGIQKIGAVAQFKTAWLYSGGMLDKMFTTNAFVDHLGKFAWGARSSDSEFIKQLWSSLVAMECNFAYWSNGEHSFFAVRQAYDVIEGQQAKHRLIVSEPKKHTKEVEPRHDILRAAIGMGFAAIDKDEWATEARGQIDIIKQLVGDEQNFILPQNAPQYMKMNAPVLFDLINNILD